MSDDLVDRLRDEAMCAAGDVNWERARDLLVLAADRIEELEADLADYEQVLDEVSKVYDDITSGRVLKPNTTARDVLREHEAVCWAEHENEIRKLQAFIHRLADEHHIPEILCEDICEVVCAGPCEGRRVGPLGEGEQ